MRHRRNFALFIIGSLTVLQGTGCGSKVKTPGVYPVRGTVLVKGEPAEYANVILIPAETDSKKRKAYGVVGADGTFQLSTQLQFDGAEPGEYFVTVSWKKPKNPKISDSDDGPELLPKNYQDPQKSGLKVVVEPRDNQMKPFELTAKS